MQYEIQIKPQAIKDGKRIPKKELRKIFAKIDALKEWATRKRQAIDEFHT
jgi:mRNA-degrading endonuclease RelE of RelBE toxin-antitoxin system